MDNIKTKGVFSQKMPYSMEHYEDCSENDIMAITMNPQDGYQCFDKAYVSDRLLVVNSKFSKLLIEKLEHCSYYLRTEISTLGRVHYHGYVIIKDKRKFYLNIHKLMPLCTFKIKNIDDIDEWETYISKQNIPERISNCEQSYINDRIIYKRQQIETLIDSETDAEL